MDGVTTKKVILLTAIVGVAVAGAYLGLQRYSGRVCTFHETNTTIKTSAQTLNTQGLRSTWTAKSKGNLFACESCERGVPNVIIQYGLPRTASTLQFQILCLMMILVHSDSVQNVGCDYNKKANTKYSVIKTHTITTLLKLMNRDSWLFVTTDTSRKPERTGLALRKLKERNVTIRYVADLKMVSKKGYHVVHDYQDIFGLSDEKMAYLADHLKYWDILRKCCGKQMSSQWRLMLISAGKYNKHFDKQKPAYPACEMYNISEVEQLFMNSYIYKKYNKFELISNVIRRPSLSDRDLDGSYCERCNKNITKYHLKIHEPCA